jgi:hypothetical protein
MTLRQSKTMAIFYPKLGTDLPMQRGRLSVSSMHGNVLTLGTPVVDTYLSTWPDCQADGIADYSTDSGGPANIA